VDKRTIKSEWQTNGQEQQQDNHNHNHKTKTNQKTNQKKDLIEPCRVNVVGNKIFALHQIDQVLHRCTDVPTEGQLFQGDDHVLSTGIKKNDDNKWTWFM
jgi:hypothetical protein